MSKRNFWLVICVAILTAIRRSFGNKEAEVLVLVSYDVATADRAGRGRLRRVSKTCTDFGQRVQNSVFECEVDPAQWVTLRNRLLEVYEKSEDSLRFYFLGDKWRTRIEHHGTKSSYDPGGPLIV